jgi:uncharacterized membrane protein
MTATQPVPAVGTPVVVDDDPVVTVDEPLAPARSRRLDAVAARPDSCFVVLATIFGLLFLILTPPLLGGDERDHFMRAYQLSQGQLFAVEGVDAEGFDTLGGTFPETLATDVDRIAREVFLSEDRTSFLDLLDDRSPHGVHGFVPVSTTASYSPGSYVPGLVAIGIGRIVDTSTLLLVYLARLAGLAAYVAIVALAIRRTPTHPWVFAACGLVPAALGQASTVTADTLTTALSFFVVASALRLAVTPADAIPRRWLVEAAVATVALGSCKPPYVVLALLYLLPVVQHRGRRLTLWLGGAVAAGFVVEVLWGIYLAGHLVSADNPQRWLAPDAFTYAFQGIDTQEQIVRIITHPWDFVAVVVRTAWRTGWVGLGEVVSRLGLYRTGGIIALGAVAWILASPTLPARPDDTPLPGRVRIALGAVVAVVVLGILVIAYAYWNEVGAPVIEALPQRYWIPLLPAMVIAVAPGPGRRAARLRPGWRTAVAAGLGVVVLVGTTVGLVRYHSEPPLRVPDPSPAADVDQGASGQ